MFPPDLLGFSRFLLFSNVGLLIEGMQNFTMPSKLSTKNRIFQQSSKSEFSSASWSPNMESYSSLTNLTLMVQDGGGECKHNKTAKLVICPSFVVYL